MNINKLFDYSVPAVAATTIFVVALLVSTWYGGKVAYDIKLGNDTIAVTGSAKQSVTADAARWNINLDAHVGMSEQQSGLDKLDIAAKKIVAYLDSAGYTTHETPPSTVSPEYAYPQNSAPIQTGYIVNRTITVTSSDIEGISKLANNIQPFTGTGYNVSTGMLELTYSKLAELRVSLLTAAIKDATERAKAIAQESGRTVGVLRNASSGVVQVLPQGGVEISDYGTYDTSSLHKDIMVTVRASFALK